MSEISERLQRILRELKRDISQNELDAALSASAVAGLTEDGSIDQRKLKRVVLKAVKTARKKDISN